MKNINRSAFTLVELLVVITILAIISVVAYQNFGGAVDKAVSGRKISDVSTIESSLQQYKVDSNYYPPVEVINPSSNRWGYDSGTGATKSNTLVVGKTGEELDSITTAVGGGRVMGINGTTDWTDTQLGAKGTISQAVLGKKYLTKDLYDPEIGDIKIKDYDSASAGLQAGTLIDAGIGRYTYAVFKKPLSGDIGNNWGTNKQGTYYNIAYTIKIDGGDKYVTKIVGDYDNESCFDEKDNCPTSLIGSSASVLSDKDPNSSSNTGDADQGIPYPVSGY